MLAYEDGVAAMRWLSLAFGFETKAQWVGEDGRLAHGELERGGQSLLIASPIDYLSPATQRARHPETFAWYDQPWIFDGVLIWVEQLEPVLEAAWLWGPSNSRRWKMAFRAAERVWRIPKAIDGLSLKGRDSYWQESM